MRYWDSYDEIRLLQEEDELLVRINAVLDTLHIPVMGHLGEMFDCDERFLLTFTELDHYPQRESTRYLGMFPQPAYGAAPVWPKVPGPRVFAYLHPWKTLPELFALLGEMECSALVYAPDLPEALRRQSASERVLFSDRPLDVSKAGGECDFAITNATLATTSALLILGKPVIMIPLNLEQVMVARRVESLGAGINIIRGEPAAMREALRLLLETGTHATAARAFAARYTGLDQQWQTRQMLQSIEELLAQPPNPTG